MRKMKSSNFLYLLSTLLIVWTVAGCAPAIQKRARPGETRSKPAARPLEPISTPQSPPPYRLGFGDVLEIRFFNNSEFNVTVPVRPDGRISIERVGELYVEGQTVEFVDEVITREYAKFLRAPEVTVIVKEFGSNQVYVLGEVNRPGLYPITKEMSIIQAIAAAGGPKEGAKLNSVLLIRKRANGAPAVGRVDIDNALENRSRSQNLTIDVRPLDVVFVPRTFIADLSNFMTRFYAAVLPPVDAYLRALFWSRR